MGQQLKSIIDQASDISMQAKLKLIMISGITSVKAVAEPDSPELVKKMTEALRTVQSEFS